MQLGVSLLSGKKEPNWRDKVRSKSDDFTNLEFLDAEVARQRARLEEAQARGKQDDRFNRRARIDFLQAKIDVLTEGQDVPDSFYDEPSTPIVDQEKSPVFAPAGAAVLGVGAGNYRKVGGVWVKAAQNVLGIKPTAKRKLTPAQKAVKLGAKIFSKIPKSLVPDAELLGVGKIFGKAAGRAFGPLVGFEIGRNVIGKIDEVVAKRQFGKMEEILAQGQPQIAKVAKIPSKKVPKVPGKPAGKLAGMEPPRPRPPTSSTVSGRGKVPGSKPTPKAKLPTQIKVTLKKRKLPKNIPMATPAQMGIPTNTNVKRILEAATVIAKISKGLQLGNQLGLIGGTSSVRNSEPRITNSLLPRSQTSPRALFANPPATTGTSSGCYTVCRKKSSGQKKRKKPRICVTPAAAKKAGLL